MAYLILQVKNRGNRQFGVMHEMGMIIDGFVKGIGYYNVMLDYDTRNMRSK